MANIRNTFTIVDNASATLRRVDLYAKQVVATFERLDKIGKQSDSISNTMREVDRYSKSAADSLNLVAPAIIGATGAVAAMVPVLTAAAAVAEQLAAAVNVASFGAAGAAGGASNAATGMDGNVGGGGGGGIDVGSLGSLDVTSSWQIFGEALKQAAEIMVIIWRTGWKWGEAVTSGAEALIYGLQDALDLAQEIWSQVQDIAETTDFVRGSIGRLEVMAPGMNGTEAFGAMYDLANSTYSDLETTMQAVNRSFMTGIFGEGQQGFQGASKFVELLNKSLVATGTNAQQAASAIEQLMQGIGAGQLYWQDLRIILQQAPGLALVLEQGLNKVTDGAIEAAGGLRNAVSEGLITSENIVKAFSAMEDEINTMFGNMPRLFSQMETVFQNVFTMLLGYLGQTGGAMDLLINKMEEFNNWLTKTEEGAQMLAMIGTAAEGFVLVVNFLLDQVGALYTYLVENSWIVIALLGAMGVAALIAGAQMVISFAAAHWQLLLIITIIGLMVRNMVDAGMTTQEIILSVLTTFLTAALRMWNMAILLAEFLINAIVNIHNFFINAVYGAQVLWLNFQILVSNGALAIMNLWLWIMEGIFSVMSSVLSGISQLIQAVWGPMSEFVTWLLERVLDVANALNALPFVEIETSGIQSAIDNLAAIDPSGIFNGITDAFDKTLQDQRDSIQAQMDKIADLESRRDDLMDRWQGAVWDPVDLKWLAVENPSGTAAEWAGKITGVLQGLFDKFQGLGENGLGGNFQEWLGGLGLDDLLQNPTGGRLDEVGKITSDVNLSDEDLQLLRDVAARDFLLNLSTITPQVNVQFGDVRETADVDALMETIADMAEEALATSLVYS